MATKLKDLPPFDSASANPFVIGSLQALTPDADPMSEDSLFRRQIGTTATGVYPFVELERLTNDALVRLDRANGFVAHLEHLSDLWLKVTTRRRTTEDFQRAWQEFDEFSLRVPWCDPFGWPGLLQPHHTDRFPAHPDGFRIGSREFPNAHAAAGGAGPLIHDLWLAAHADIGVEMGNETAPADPLPVISAFFKRFENGFRSGHLGDLLEAVAREYRAERSFLQSHTRASQDGQGQRGLRWSRAINISDVIRFFGVRQKEALEDLRTLRIPYSVISRERVHVGLHGLDPDMCARFERAFGGSRTAEG